MAACRRPLVGRAVRARGARAAGPGANGHGRGGYRRRCVGGAAAATGADYRGPHVIDEILKTISRL